MCVLCLIKGKVNFNLVGLFIVSNFGCDCSSLIKNIGLMLVLG